MATLPGGTYLIQQIGDEVILFHRHTEYEIVRYNVYDNDATARAQQKIHDTPMLDSEQKSFAHFWCGYFYALAVYPDV